MAPLITPEITPYVAIGDFSWGFWLFLPDYFVHLSESRFLAGIVGDPRFEGRYLPVTTLPGYSGLQLTVYRRADVPRPELRLLP